MQKYEKPMIVSAVSGETSRGAPWVDSDIILAVEFVAVIAALVD